MTTPSSGSFLVRNAWTQAAYRVSGMEIGGLLGTLSSGVISDKVKGSRVPVICLYLLGMIVLLQPKAAN